jgi:hypothetical protein
MRGEKCENKYLALCCEAIQGCVSEVKQSVLEILSSRSLQN